MKIIITILLILFITILLGLIATLFIGQRQLPTDCGDSLLCLNSHQGVTLACGSINNCNCSDSESTTFADCPLDASSLKTCTGEGYCYTESGCEVIYNGCKYRFNTGMDQCSDCSVHIGLFNYYWVESLRITLATLLAWWLLCIFALLIGVIFLSSYYKISRMCGITIIVASTLVWVLSLILGILFTIYIIMTH